MTHEPIFFATSNREADAVEQILKTENIDFSQRLEAIPHDTSNVCFQGFLFEVPKEQAENARRLLAENGFETRHLELPKRSV